MSVEPLFLDRELDFGVTKTAGTTVRLSDRADNWPQEIMGEAYKQLPYLGGLDVNVVLDRTDEERGYAFGSIEVRAISDLPEATRRKRLNMVHIPIIVIEQTLQPLDIFVHGKRYNHLTEARLRAVLFRADIFDISDEVPPNQPFGNELMPPATGMHYGSGGVKIGQAAPAMSTPLPMVAPPVGTTAPPPTATTQPTQVPPITPPMPPTTKTSSAVPLLPQLHGRILVQHVDRLKTAMCDPTLQAKFANANKGVQAALFSAMKLEPMDLKKSAHVLLDNIKPDVVQLCKQNDGHYRVKWAAADNFAPQEQIVPAEEAEQMLGSGPATEEMNQTGMTTMSPTSIVAPPEDEEIRIADQFGIWKVEDTVGNQLIGWVFPTICDFTHRPLPISLFTSGVQYSTQDQIAGKMVGGKSTDLPKGQPQGYGALFSDKKAKIKVFLPMRVVSTFKDPAGVVNYITETDDGQRITFYYSGNIRELVQVADGQIIVPDDYCWLPLKNEIELVSDPSLFTKVAVQQWSSTAELISDGSVFSYRGPAVAKLASVHTKFIDRPQAEFMGRILGLSSSFTKTALEKASAGECVALAGVRQVVPLGEKLANARSSVRQALGELEHPIRNYFLVKEASLLEDALTADKILGLGFINAENVATFVDMLPSLEDTQSKLSEMLLFSRLGQKEVPEVAIERMLAALEDVINGLRTLKQKELPERG